MPDMRSRMLVIVFGLGILGIANDWGVFRQPTRQARNKAAFADAVLAFDGFLCFLNKLQGRRAPDKTASPPIDA